MTVPRPRPLLGALVAAILLCASVSSAQTPATGYRPPTDYAIEWARNISLAGVAVAVILIVYVLGARRRFITAAASQWLLFIGICVMPLPVMVLNSAVGLEQAKDVSFCQSCHVMQPFVSDMRNPASQRLAAVHFKNRYIQRSHCYVCHTDYGLFGTLEAKLAGMGHVWKEASGSYALPVRIARPYRWTICLDCHGGSAKFEGVPEHQGLVPKIERNEATCTSCHGDSHLSGDDRRVSR